MLKNKNIIILFLFLIVSAKGDITDIIKHPSYENLKNISMDNAIATKDSAGREAFAIKDLTYKGVSNPFVTDILLSFNNKSSHLYKDDTGKYIIKNASYDMITNSGTLGEGAAGFFKKDHNVQIETSKNLWLGGCNDLGSFTIEFRIFPVNSEKPGILFSRVGYFSGKKNGLEIKIVNKKIIVELYRIFKDAKGIRYDVRLVKGKELLPKNWYNFVLSFDRVSGKLAKYINGFEEEVVYVTETDRAFEDVYEPSFECIDMPAAVIGKEYYGFIDEFRISYQKIDDLKRDTEVAFQNYKKPAVTERWPANKPGIITSPVYSFDSTGTSITLFSWAEFLKENTYIWMEFRISDSLFKNNDENLKWYRIVNNQKNIYLMQDAGGFLRGKYYQWRAHLIPSPDGKYSPYLYNIDLTYRLDPPPKSPQFLEVVSTGDKSVVLRWNKNVEHDIFGYRIYYGMENNKYDGILGYVNGRRITNEFNNNRKYIEINVTNDVIEENKAKDRTGVLEYPLLNNTVLYFFSVTAYDTYKPDTPHNHESSFSKEVKARPFAGSEIKAVNL